MSPRRPVSHLAEAVIGAFCFERRPADPAVTARLREEAGHLEAEAATARAGVDTLWEAKRAELRRQLRSDNPARFMRWPPVRTTMVKRGHRSVVHEFRHLRERADWPTRWRPAVREMTLGCPRPFPRLPTTSANALHLAYHLCRFEDVTRMPPERAAFVLEFGGGYGGMCRLLHRLGFRGTYVIFDLPEVTALQRFYLRHADLPVDRWTSDGRRDGVLTTSNLSDLPHIVASRPAGPALFIATWSLGETPAALRAPVFAAVSEFDAFLLGYTARFAGIDNRAAFARWQNRLLDYTWHEIPLPHLGKAEWYRFGTRKAW